VALSNRRLRRLDGDQVEFAAKDYAAGGKQRLVRLPAAEFLRRWVQHVLPGGFVKIRHYGLLANRDRAARLGLCRALLGVWALAQAVVGLLGKADAGAWGLCPSCGSAQWGRVAELPRQEIVAEQGPPARAPLADTS
jgi:hypothetical protein